MFKKKNLGSWEELLSRELEKADCLQDDFCIMEDIEGYERCDGLNREKCLSDCAFSMMMPTISSVN